MQIATKQDGISIEVGSVAAQLPYDETLANVTITGSSFTECSQCGEKVHKGDLTFHKEYTCRERQEICTRCGRLYKPGNGLCTCYSYSNSSSSEQYESGGKLFCSLCNKVIEECICDEYVVIGHYNYKFKSLWQMLELGIKVQGVYGLKGKIYCAWCNKPIDICICGGCVVTGKNKQSVANVTWHIGGKNNRDNGEDDDTETDDSTVEENDTVAIGALPTSGRISVSDFLSLRKYGVHIANLNIPKEFHEQTLKYECVVRGIANIAQILGKDYDVAYQVLYKMATDKGYNLKNDGILDKNVNKLFSNYVTLSRNICTETFINNQIDNHNNVLVSIWTEEGPHMVTVLGYDNHNYYCAAGFRDVDIISKDLVDTSRSVFVVKQFNGAYK